MQRHGHTLNIGIVGTQLVANCQCRNWCRTLPLTDGADLMNLVGMLTGKHHRHLERLGRPQAMDASGEGPLVPREEPSKN